MGLFIGSNGENGFCTQMGGVDGAMHHHGHILGLNIWGTSWANQPYERV